MLKKRLIACLTLLNDIVVQSVHFRRYLPVGTAKIAVEFLEYWDIDEIIILDISATREGRKLTPSLITGISKHCFVPVTVGGGIKTVDDIRETIHSGADKISINSAALANPDFIAESAGVFGNQCIVVAMDVKTNAQGDYEIYTDSGRYPTGLHPVHWAKTAESLGAGELLINSIDRDGSKKGYDVSLLKMISQAVKIPVIALGGVGQPYHFVEGVKEGGVDAVAAGNIFHWTEHSAVINKAYMYQAGIDVRLNSIIDYREYDFDQNGRILGKVQTSLFE